jgi:hypothetical protein
LPYSWRQALAVSLAMTAIAGVRPFKRRYGPVPAHAASNQPDQVIQ